MTSKRISIFISDWLSWWVYTLLSVSRGDDLPSQICHYCLGKCRWLRTSLRCFNSGLMRALNSTTVALRKYSNLSAYAASNCCSLKMNLGLLTRKSLETESSNAFSIYFSSMIQKWNSVTRIKQTQILPDPRVFLEIVTHTVSQLGLAVYWIPEKQHNCTHANQIRRGGGGGG